MRKYFLGNPKCTASHYITRHGGFDINSASYQNKLPRRYDAMLISKPDQDQFLEGLFSRKHSACVSRKISKCLMVSKCGTPWARIVNDVLHVHLLHLVRFCMHILLQINDVCKIIGQLVYPPYKTNWSFIQSVLYIVINHAKCIKKHRYLVSDIFHVFITLKLVFYFD